MRQRIRVCDLAHELHISSLDVVQAAHALGINVIRATALLTTGQEYRIREWHANGHIRRRQVQLVAEEPAIPPPRDEERSARCNCCEYVFLYKPLQESHQICPECRGHFEETGESFVRTLQRHEDHVAQSRRKVDDYRESANRLSRERDEAYTKRNKWMAALVEIVVAHGPADDGDGCACGSPEFPCVTRRHLRHVNKGIYNRCEELEQMNEADFNRVLYGRDYAFFQDWEDGTA
jgi:Zn-finger nucleic acid-binding protein